MQASKLIEVKQIGMVAFPGYTGKKFQVQVLAGEITLKSYWSGGSRDYWAFVDLATMRQRSVQENGTPYSNGGQVERLSQLPFNVALVRHCISCGRDLGLTIYVHPENMNQLAIADKADLTWEEKVVLSATRGLKSSYAGIKDYRFQEAKEMTGITREQWDAAKSALITRKLLNAAGAITDDGKNAIEWTKLSELKQNQVAK